MMEKMKTLAKLLGPYLFILLLLFFVSFFFYSQISHIKRSLQSHFSIVSKEITVLGKRIGPGAVVSPSSFSSSKEFSTILKELEITKGLLKELQAKGYKPAVVTQTRAVVQERIVEKIVSDKRVGQIYWKGIEYANKLRVGEVGFNTQDLKTPWSIKLSPLQLGIHTIVSKKPGLPDRVGTEVFFLQDGKRIPAYIVSSTTSVLRPSPIWSLKLDPSISMGFVLGVSSSTLPGIQLGVPWLSLQRGETYWFRWLTPLVGYQEGFLIGLEGMSANVGALTPFFKDLWLGIGIGYNYPKGGLFLLTLSTTL